MKIIWTLKRIYSSNDARNNYNIGNYNKKAVENITMQLFIELFNTIDSLVQLINQ